MSLKRIVAIASVGCGLVFGILMFISIQTSMHVFEGMSALKFDSPETTITSIFSILALILIICVIAVPALNLLIAFVAKKQATVERTATGAALSNASFLFVLELVVLVWLFSMMLAQGGGSSEEAGELLKLLFSSTNFIVPLIIILASSVLWAVANKIENDVAKIVMYGIGAIALTVMIFVFFKEAIMGAAGVIAIIFLIIEILSVVFLAVMPMIGLDKGEEQPKAE